MLRNIKSLFEHEKKKRIVINQSEQVIFGVTIISNTEVTVIKIKHYQLKNILIKLFRILNNVKNLIHGKFS